MRGKKGLRGKKETYELKPKTLHIMKVVYIFLLLQTHFFFYPVLCRALYPVGKHFVIFIDEKCYRNKLCLLIYLHLAK